MNGFDFAELNRAMHEAAQAMIPADLRAKGWRYVDLPARVTPEAWGLILSWMGEGEYQCIAMTAGKNEAGEYRRGQFFISPQGAKNLADKQRGERIRAMLSDAEASSLPPDVSAAHATSLPR